MEPVLTRANLLQDLAVILPALDEERSLPGVLHALPPGPRVVVVDNGSTDRTADAARRGGAEVVREPRRGYGSAVQAGLRHLRGRPPEVVVILDADHADHPDLLPVLAGPALRDEADLVLSDRSRTADPGALTTTQRYGNHLATALIWGVTGHRYRDMGPFRALRWDAACRLDLTDPTFGWNVEMQIKAVRAGLRIVEIPVPYRARGAGRSKISGSLRGATRAGVRILWAVGHYARH
ncbi:MAG: glycosyltransferase family 2 protein [Deltaproteobacteria bacterium]|nr:MAG: glycosyltransferase family 2 protein [Deltaproteobacteria bacterium]